MTLLLYIPAELLYYYLGASENKVSGPAARTAKRHAHDGY